MNGQDYYDDEVGEEEWGDGDEAPPYNDDEWGDGDEAPPVRLLDSPFRVPLVQYDRQTRLSGFL